jgi:hypothetical protein
LVFKREGNEAMTRAEIVKDLRARGWNGAITKEIAENNFGYTCTGPDYEWSTSEPSLVPEAPKPVVKPKAPVKPIPAAIPAKQADEKAAVDAPEKI